MDACRHNKLSGWPRAQNFDEKAMRACPHVECASGECGHVHVKKKEGGGVWTQAECGIDSVTTSM
jgi:hypothetical protein